MPPCSINLTVTRALPGPSIPSIGTDSQQLLLRIPRTVGAAKPEGLLLVVVAHHTKSKSAPGQVSTMGRGSLLRCGGVRRTSHYLTASRSVQVHNPSSRGAAKTLWRRSGRSGERLARAGIEAGDRFVFSSRSFCTRRGSRPCFSLAHF